MAYISSPDHSDAAPEPDPRSPDEDRGRRIREARGLIEADLLREQSLQRHIIERSGSARTFRRRVPD